MLRDVRPVGIVSLHEGDIVPGHEPLLVTISRERAGAFAMLAPCLAYGSVVVFTGLTEDDLRGLSVVAEANDFRPWQPAGLDRGEHCFVKSHAFEFAYGSHLLYLLAAVRATTGTVLELGCGEGSTVQLHEEAALRGRKLVSVDNDLSWLKRFEEPLRGHNHYFIHDRDPGSSVWLDEDWSVVFVDHAPGETRARAIERVRDRAEYVVVHDTETASYGTYEVIETFKYKRHFRYTRPWTSAASMTREIFESPYEAER
jgi:hypothetical protein